MCREGAGSVAQSGEQVHFFCRGGVPVYQALYRKYRPKTFSEVVGQQHITDTLQRQVADGQVGHAYLFTGTRGTGKTTCARILAKAVNCESPIDGAPCNRCAACRGIDDGSLLDVTELDAASNGSVNDARTLREEAIYPPSVLKKRVYIIDEVHMLSKDAFNALLKIMEEPPEHLLFILATTELQKVLPTILSRCQRFTFKRILPRDMEQHLLRVAEKEGIDLTADGAELLARMANGALRDALSLLDQCRAAAGTVDAKTVLDTLGLAGSTQTLQLMRLLLARQGGDALGLLDQLYRGGKDVAAMLDYADPALRARGFQPYYLYRQKYMSGSFENVGWCISGAEGLYNIYIMEELHSILSLGAGGSTKMVDTKRNRIERVFHPKFPLEYIQRPEKLAENLETFRRFHENMR